MSGFKSATIFKIIILSFHQEPLIFNENQLWHGWFHVKEKNTLSTGRVSDLIQKTVVYEISVTNTLAMQKPHSNPSANNGSVFRSVAPKLF